MCQIKQVMVGTRQRKGVIALLGMIICFLVFLVLANPSSARTQSVTFTLFWQDNSNNEDGFVVQRRERREGDHFVDVVSVGANVVSAEDTITDNVGGVTYCYRVLAYNSTGRSAASNESCRATPTLGPVIITVNCSTASVQAALLSASPGDTVSVSGTCDENVLVQNDKTMAFLDGGGTAVINGVDPSLPAIDVRGNAIVIQGFTITGGSNGIEVQRGAKALITDNVIQNTGGSGVVVNQLAFAVLTNNTIEGNAGGGVVVTGGAAARIGFNNDTETMASPNTIQGNSGNGISVADLSSARVVGNVISANGGDGVMVGGRSQADLANNTIESNGGDGVFVSQNAVVNLGEDSGSSIYQLPNSTSGNNVGFGLGCTDGGVASGRLGTLNGFSGLISFDTSCINDLL